MNAKLLITKLLKSGAEFVIYTDIAYGRGLNGIDYDSYGMHSEFGGDLKTRVDRIFEPKDDYLEITERYTPPKIPWNKAAEKEPYTRKKYIGYDRITYINEII